MKILIAGGAGFIGFHLAQAHRQRGDEVVILDNFFKTDGRPDQDFEAFVAGSGVTYPSCRSDEALARAGGRPL